MDFASLRSCYRPSRGEDENTQRRVIKKRRKSCSFAFPASFINYDFLWGERMELSENKKKLPIDAFHSLHSHATSFNAPWSFGLPSVFVTSLYLEERKTEKWVKIDMLNEIMQFFSWEGDENLFSRYWVRSGISSWRKKKFNSWSRVVYESSQDANW